MSIIITNIGGDPAGVCQYELKINGQLIATFRHNRQDGLARCLHLAAEAAEGAKLKKWVDDYEKMTNAAEVEEVYKTCHSRRTNCRPTEKVESMEKRPPNRQRGICISTRPSARPRRCLQKKR